MEEEKVQNIGEEQKKKRKRNNYYRKNKRRNYGAPKDEESIVEANNETEEAHCENEEDSAVDSKSSAEKFVSERETFSPEADVKKSINQSDETSHSEEEKDSGDTLYEDSSAESAERHKGRIKKRNRKKGSSEEKRNVSESEVSVDSSVNENNDVSGAKSEKNGGLSVTEDKNPEIITEVIKGRDNERNSTSEVGNREEIIGIRFRDTGKIYYFSPGKFKVCAGDSVIVETVRGVELGNVAIPNKMVPVSEIVSPLKSVVRMATEEDKKRVEENKKVEAKAREFFSEKVREHNLSMTLVDVEYTFDNTKLLFYFTSEGRVDFRELVKELASVYKTRIELRQIGVRDEAKQIGGLGICGRPFCCKTFLNDFQQVTIKMAKDQNLSLNSTKISGTCGRLMCCLRYENDVYEEEAKKTPRVDSIVETPMGRGVVTEANVLLGMIKVVLDKTPEAAPESFHRSKVKVISSKKKEEDIPEDLKELEENN